jgi:hypothetical protein
VVGPVRMRLYVQASVPYIDLHARLADVSPRGRSTNITDGIVRLTDSAPDTLRPVEFDLWPVAHAFRRGHRIQLEVSGGAPPRYERNHGTAEPLATSTPLRASDRTVLHDAQHPPQCGHPRTADTRGPPAVSARGRWFPVPRGPLVQSNGKRQPAHRCQLGVTTSGFFGGDRLDDFRDTLGGRRQPSLDE